MCFVSGIGRPPGKMDTANYVLRQFSRQEQDEVKEEKPQHYLKESFLEIIVNTKKSLIVSCFAVRLYIPNRGRGNKDSFA